jgi:L-arabinose isomerase
MVFAEGVHRLLTCALLRAVKAMAADLKGGTSFMEDYTDHLHPDAHLVLGFAYAGGVRIDCRGEALPGNHPLSIGR